MVYQEPIITWWKTFNDPVLDSLVTSAQENNRRIWASIANYNAAMATYKNRKLDKLPELYVNGAYSRTRLGENIFVPGINPIYSQYDGFFSSNWELDFFGRASNRAKQSFANQQLSLAEIRQTYLTVTAEAARAYFDLLGSYKRLRTAEKNLTERENAFKLTKSLSDSGLSNELDVSRALVQVEQTKAFISQLNAKIDATQNFLHTLLGDVNLSFDSVERELPKFPDLLPDGDFYVLLRHRPDVMIAENRVKSQIAKYNIAVADLYPKISINGNIGFSAIDPASFGSNSSFAWSFMPSISWAGLNLGRVKRTIQTEDALAIAAITNYEQVVLEAFQEMKTSWSNLYHELQRKESLQKTFEASEKSALLARQRYEAGIDDFFDYLLANETLLQTEDALVQSEVDILNNYINLYKSIGVGWENIDSEYLDQKYDLLQEKYTAKN